MRSYLVTSMFGALAFAAPLLLSSSASADIGACGALGSLECEFETGGGCKSECTPLNVTAQCGIKCSGECTASASAECSSSCKTDCIESCTPGETHCKTVCVADCSVHCESSCDDSSCQASCEGSCEGHCAETCIQDPPDCDTICETSCKGSCEVKANVDCHVDCQGGCQGELTGGCELECDAPHGALFCDGQYVQLDNYDGCAANFEFDASGQVTTSCSAAPSSGAPINGAALATLAAGIGIVVARRRAKK